MNNSINNNKNPSSSANEKEFASTEREDESEENIKNIPEHDEFREHIKLAQGEVIAKDYFVAKADDENKGVLHYIITNKRLIMYIWSKNSVIVRSVKISDVVSTAVWKTKFSFSIIINIKSATGALTFYSSPKGFLEKRLQPEELNMKVNEGPDLGLMAKELGALILNMRK